MPTPDFVLALRERVGHELLWLSGVTAVVLRDSDQGRQVLLVKRADNGAWTPVTGIIDPGEEPAVAGARECLEEADIVAAPEALVRVKSLPPMTYANGDRSQYLDLTFRFRYVSGEPFPADGENTEAAWFPVDAMPEMSEEMSGRVAAALMGSDVATFEA
ncbi:NUDIX domain-containing protein [Demequina sp. NBRC 110054]|uniref:NUDIX hydrolase n=1 Tax=Demequina sp. NBRC 110054 TaxID=1570343 RepID=UPI000A071A1F|nr:NUDIX domain-containing protein [Demequina sp. NBRC 110054]